MTFKEYVEQSWNYDGQSAKCIYGFATGNRTELNYPHDPDDWCRCLQVLRLLYSNNDSIKVYLLNRIGEHYKSKHYIALAENYYELMRIFKTEWESNLAQKTYNFMRRIYGEVVGR